MVASILQSLGVNLGPDDEMMPANQFNEAGYFENASAVGLNESFLKKNDLSWRTLPALDLKKSLNWVEDYSLAVQELSAKLAQTKPWGLKDPRLSYLLPFWKAAAGKTTSAVICLRRPEAVALSLNIRNALSVSYGAALWELYTLAALRNTRRMARLVVVYEDLLAHPKKTIENLIDVLPELAELNPDANTIREAIGRVRRDLDHSKPVNKKVMPPAVNELYDRVAAGDLRVTKDDTRHGVSMELVRLETGHQAAKRMHGEALEQLEKASKELASERAALARHTERLGDVVSLVTEPGEIEPTDREKMLQRLRQAARLVPGPAQKGFVEEAARELVRAKDERIEWLRLELGATGSRGQAALDHAASLEIALNKATAARQLVAESLENARTRLAENDALIAQLQGERREDEARIANLRRIANEREMLFSDLNRVTATLEQRNDELAELAVRERQLSRQAYKLDSEVERLQQDLMQSRIREAELTTALASRTQAENALRAALDQQNAVATELQQELTAGRAAIDTLGEENKILIAEHEELKRALQLARARTEQLGIELSAKSNGSHPKAATPVSDQRLRRQLLVMDELLHTIDQLLSPKYGRFAIPVRQIRVRLSQARQVLDGEVAMTRSR